MYSNLSLVRDLWRYLKPYKLRFFGATFARIIADLSWLYPAYALAEIVTFLSAYTAGTSLRPVYVTFALLTLATTLRYAGIYIAKSTTFRFSEKIEAYTQVQAMRHLFLLDISWHEGENAGNKLKRIEHGATSIHRIFRMWINNIIEIVINFIGVIIILYKFDGVIAGFTVFFLVTFFLLSSYFQKRGVAAHTIVTEKEENVHGLLFEAINNIRSVKVMSMMEKLLSILYKTTDDMLKSIYERIFWMQSGHTIRHYYANMFRAGLLAFITYGVVHGRYEVGFLILFNGYFGNIIMSVGELTDITEDFAIEKWRVHRLQSMLSVPIAIEKEEGKVPLPKNWQKISIKNLSFSYGTSSQSGEKTVLSDISFDIARGEKVGIVGLSGAGKSTIFKLLLKEHESYSGGIYFDNTLLKNVSKKEYFNHIAVVLQDTELFNATLKENITITNAKEEKNRELLDKSLSIAHIRDFASKLPKGIETIIGEKGVKLSGGERQRVGIARAVFKNPELLLLDEATSHLDIDSEEKIRDSLHQFFQSVTAIVIAHRLTTIKEMDKILVIEDGKIIESGDFKTLHKKRGRFFDLWEKQKL